MNDDRFGGLGRDPRHDDRSFGSGRWRDDADRGRQGGFGQGSERHDPRGFGAFAPHGSDRPPMPQGDRGTHDDRLQPPPSAFRQSGRDNDRFDNRDQDRSVAIDETSELIASNKVEGTRVYNRHGERLGTIENFMVGKRSGRVEYAVMSFGGFLGMGGRYYPLPWRVLRYDEQLAGYRIDIDGDERSLRHAPSFRAGEEPRWDRAFGQHVYGFYGLTY